MTDQDNAPTTENPFRKPRVPAFWQDAPEYHGTLAARGDERIAISPNGARYLFQRRAPDGKWAVVNWRKTLAALRPLLPAPLDGTALDALPDDPREVPRPWADAMQSAGLAVRRGILSRDEWRGVIATDGAARIAISPKRTAFLLQARQRDGSWKVVRTSREARGLLLRLHRSEAERARSGPGVVSRRLFDLALLLPPVEYCGEADSASETLTRGDEVV